MENETIVYKKSSDEIDLSVLLKVFVRKWHIIVIISVLAAVVAGIIASATYVPKYTSSVSFLIHTENTDASQYRTDESLINTYEVAFKHNEEFCHKLNILAGTEDILSDFEVAEMMECSQILQNTATFSVSFTSTDKKVSYNLTKALQILANDELEATFSGLSQLDVFNAPKLASLPSNENLCLKVALIVFAVCAVVSYAVFAFLTLHDTTIRNEKSLEVFAEYPILGVIPSFEDVSGKRGKGLKGER